MLVKLSIILLLPCFSLFAEEKTELSEDSTKVDDRMERFYHNRIDSLEEELQALPQILRMPRMRNDFERQMGILPAPDPKSVEPYGIILEADPTVDLSMIYPKSTREKIVEGKKKKVQLEPNSQDSSEVLDAPGLIIPKFEPQTVE